jgi:hypothetical protein
MSIVQAEEAAATNASLSTRWTKFRRRYINHDHEVAYFRLQHDYFNDDCCFQKHLTSRLIFSNLQSLDRACVEQISLV